MALSMLNFVEDGAGLRCDTCALDWDRLVSRCASHRVLNDDRCCNPALSTKKTSVAKQAQLKCGCTHNGLARIVFGAGQIGQNQPDIVGWLRGHDQNRSAISGLPPKLPFSLSAPPLLSFTGFCAFLPWPHRDVLAFIDCK
jgi:hypothetical protein